MCIPLAQPGKGEVDSAVARITAETAGSVKMTLVRAYAVRMKEECPYEPVDSLDRCVDRICGDPLCREHAAARRACLGSRQGLSRAVFARRLRHARMDDLGVLSCA